MTTPPTAYLEMRVWTPSILWSDFYDDEPDHGVRDEFRHEIERAVARAVSDLLNIRRVDVEADWYFIASPCPESVSVLDHDEPCAEPTKRVHEPYGREKGVYRVCGIGHKTKYES